MPDISKGYIKKEVAKLLEIKPSQVQYYTDQGIIVPEVSAPSGRGTRRRYSKRNLLQILIVKRLVERGISLKEAKGILKGLHDWSKGLQIPDHDFPKKFPPQQKRRQKERARLARMFWEIESWDFSGELFLCIHYKEKAHIVISVLALAKKDHEIKLDETLSKGTTTFILVKITDLIQRVVNI